MLYLGEKDSENFHDVGCSKEKMDPRHQIEEQENCSFASYFIFKCLVLKLSILVELFFYIYIY